MNLPRSLDSKVNVFSTTRHGLGWEFPHIFFFFLIFIFERDREKQSMSRGGAEREREREAHNLKQAPGSELFQEEPNAGLEPLDHEIMTWAKVGCLTD